MEACLAFTHVHKFVPINRLIDRESDLRISILGSKSISHQDVIPTQLRRATVIGVRGQLDLGLTRLISRLVVISNHILT